MHFFSFIISLVFFFFFKFCLAWLLARNEFAVIMNALKISIGLMKMEKNVRQNNCCVQRITKKDFQQKNVVVFRLSKKSPFVFFRWGPIHLKIFINNVI